MCLLPKKINRNKWESNLNPIVTDCVDLFSPDTVKADVITNSLLIMCVFAPGMEPFLINLQTFIFISRSEN